MQKDYDLALEVTGKRRMPDFSSILDEEKLLRLHPHWFINDLKKEDHRVAARIKDHATGKHFVLTFSLVFDDKHIMKLAFENDVLLDMVFYDKNGVLHASVAYRDREGAESPTEDIYSINLWIRGIREYLRLYLTTSINTLFFRLIMNRVMLPMNPSQRKISVMIFRFTLLEIFVILLIVIGYVIFVQ